MKKGYYLRVRQGEEKIGSAAKHTRATTDINSAQPEGSPRDTCCRFDLISSSLIETSAITLLAAN